jgi:hypothetical protein
MPTSRILTGAIVLLICGVAVSSAFPPQEKKSKEDNGWFQIDGEDTPDEELAKREVPPQFKKIKIGGTRAGPRTIEKLRTTRAVEELDLSYGFDNEGLREIGRIETLKRLSIIDNFKCNDEGGVHLASLAKLERLDLMCPNMKDKSVIAVSKCRSLKHFSTYAQVTDPGLAALCNLNELESLQIDPVDCTPKAFAGLSKLKKLTMLTLRGRGSGDKELLGAVRAMPKLKSLMISLDGVSDEGLASIVANSTASYVNFERSPVGSRTIQAVKARKTVKKFCTDRYRISEKEEADLIAARPDLDLSIE